MKYPSNKIIIFYTEITKSEEVFKWILIHLYTIISETLVGIPFIDYLKAVPLQRIRFLRADLDQEWLN